MSNSIIPAKAASPTDLSLDAEKLVAAGPSGEDIYRERMQWTGALLAEVSTVKNTNPADSDYAGSVRPIQSDVTATGALAALNANVVVALAGRNGVAATLAAGTLAASIVYQCSFDGGVTYASITPNDPATGSKFPFVTVTNPNGVVIRSFIAPGGATHARVLVTAYTSGTAVMTLKATVFQGSQDNTEGASGALASPLCKQIAGIQYSTNKTKAIGANNYGMQYSLTPAQAIQDGSPATGLAGTIFGQASTAAVTTAALRKTAYNQPAAAAQRSFSSTSAQDAAAGTGIRTLQVTYYTSAAGVISGPFTEVITMNGAAAVNTVAVNIFYVESLIALTVGATGAAVGTITMFNAAGGGGGVLGTIAALDRQTYWAHHYVPSGSVCFVQNVICQNDGASGNAPPFFARWKNPGNANDAERETTIGWRAQGSISAQQFIFNTPKEITGPAVVVFYVTPVAAAAQISFLDADYYEYAP